MFLTDLNREGGIGANSHFIEIGPFRVLVDAGINPKLLGREATPDFTSIGWDAPLDAIVLTHAHLDHLGALPIANRYQPGAPIFLSQPTALIAARMLKNSVNVMRRQREESGITDYPLYSYRELRQTESRFHPLPYHHATRLRKEDETLEITLYPAGHVIGAASCLLRWRDETILHTGDLLFTEQSTLPGAAIPRDRVDVLILETTRGLNARSEHHTREIEVARLIEQIRETLRRGGSCLIPVFALGRTQEILKLLNEAQKAKLLPRCPVFCGGLGLSLVDQFETIARETKLVRFRRQILHELGVRPVANPAVAGKDPKEKGIYILSSGMLVENTPSYDMAAAMLGHEKNSLCFVGYCDPDTPGGKLITQKKGESFTFETIDYKTEIKADICRFDLSGHADREELVDLARTIEPGEIVLTHGDPAARQWFIETLPSVLPSTKVYNPTPLERIELGP
jgi:Cft2 family RNA processing exonuclease